MNETYQAPWLTPRKSGRKFTMRKVVRREFFSDKHCRTGEGSFKHVLECGHEIWAKQSDGTPARKHCNECAREITRTYRGPSRTPPRADGV